MPEVNEMGFKMARRGLLGGLLLAGLGLFAPGTSGAQGLGGSEIRNFDLAGSGCPTRNSASVFLTGREPREQLRVVFDGGRNRGFEVGTDRLGDDRADCSVRVRLAVDSVDNRDRRDRNRDRDEFRCLRSDGSIDPRCIDERCFRSDGSFDPRCIDNDRRFNDRRRDGRFDDCFDRSGRFDPRCLDDDRRFDDICFGTGCFDPRRSNCFGDGCADLRRTFRRDALCDDARRRSDRRFDDICVDAPRRRRNDGPLGLQLDLGRIEGLVRYVNPARDQLLVRSQFRLDDEVSRSRTSTLPNSRGEGIERLRLDAPGLGVIVDRRGLVDIGMQLELELRGGRSGNAAMRFEELTMELLLQ